MTDNWTPSKRSDVMSRVRSRGNQSTEMRLATIFRTNGITGWRRNQKLLGKPDFVFRTQRVCVFVDGCFWHGCPACYRRPNSNQLFWDTKLQRNTARDRLVTRELRKQGWRIIRIWEHQLSEKNRKRLLWRLNLYLG
ncbi:very short patch repair endonuclease [Polaromonas sp. JS666]|uniref:very short patch repair endonuclease n=1 Tax=Polaromonas sp. (strain JS666 / ATCC BAA-500) TaxID=296591 RepID=UPI0009437AE1